MPKKKKMAAPGSKRRVTVRRKSAVPDIDPAISYAIATAVEAQDIEGLRSIVLKHEAQMHSLRLILFDFLIIFREEHYKATDPVSKARFSQHIGKIRATLEENVPTFKAYHGNQNDIDDLDANESVEFMDQDFDVDVAALIREAAGDAIQREAEAEAAPPDESDLMDEMLERASEEADEWTEVTPRPHPTTQSRPPRRRRR